MHSFEEFLMSGVDACRIAPSELKAFGKRAATRYVNAGVPMNTSIREFTKEAGLNENQVKRVVEEANNAAFLAVKQRGFKQNIEYPVACVKAVMEQPTMKKVASVLAANTVQHIHGSEGVSLEAAFGVSGSAGHEKVAAAVQLARGPADRQAILNGPRNAVASKNSQGFTFMSKLASLRKLVSDARAEGHEPAVIGAAILEGRPSPQLLDVIRGEVADEATFEKTASAMGMMPSPASPFTGLVQDLEMTSQKLVAANQEMNRTQIALDGLLSILRGDVGGMMPPPGMGPLGPQITNPMEDPALAKGPAAPPEMGAPPPGAVAVAPTATGGINGKA